MRSRSRGSRRSRKGRSQLLALGKDLVERDLCLANISALPTVVGKERDADSYMNYKKVTKGVGFAGAQNTLQANALRRRRRLLLERS